MIVVSILALLGAIALPAYLHYAAESRKNLCINNLKQIDLVIQQWALEKQRGPDAPVEFKDISSYLKGRVVCPSGGTTFEDSYFISTVGVDALCQKNPQTHVWMGPLEMAGKAE